MLSWNGGGLRGKEPNGNNRKAPAEMKHLKSVAAIAGAATAAIIVFQIVTMLRQGESSLAGVEEETGGAPAGEPVRVEPVTRGEVRDTIRLTATLASSKSSPLFSPRAGIVVSVLVEEGDQVESGQVVARLDSRELALNLEGARIRLEVKKEEWRRQKSISEQALSERQAYREAKFKFELKQISLEKLVNERRRGESEAKRVEISYQSQLASEKELEEARYALDKARFEEEQAAVELKQAEEEWKRIRAMDEKSLIDEEAWSAARFAYRQALSESKLAQLRLSQATVRAPAKGVVVRKEIKAGDYVSPNSLLMVLEDLGELEAVLHLPELHWNSLQVGQPVSILPEALPGLEVGGSVTRKSPTINAESGTFKVTVTVAAPADERIKPGMFATLTIQMAARPDALLVPRQAVLGEETERYLFVVEGDLARRRKIEIGVTAGERLEVLTGVALGEQVVVAGQYSLKSNGKVRIVESAAEEKGPEEPATPPGP